MPKGKNLDARSLTSWRPLAKRIRRPLVVVFVNFKCPSHESSPKRQFTHLSLTRGYGVRFFVNFQYSSHEGKKAKICSHFSKQFSPLQKKKNKKRNIASPFFLQSPLENTRKEKKREKGSASLLK